VHGDQGCNTCNDSSACGDHQGGGGCGCGC
jgi:hypothetical protein